MLKTSICYTIAFELFTFTLFLIVSPNQIVASNNGNQNSSNSSQSLFCDSPLDAASCVKLESNNTYGVKSKDKPDISNANQISNSSVGQIQSHTIISLSRGNETLINTHDNSDQNQSTSNRIYFVAGFTQSGYGRVVAYAECLFGDVIITGGFYLDKGNNDYRYLQSQPLNSYTWITSVQGTGYYKLAANAMCIDIK